MDRLTTNNPENNLQTALNLFYVKDGQAWVRGGGPEPDYKDCSLYDYIRKTMVGVLDPVERGNIEMLTDVEIGSIMADWLMDGHCCIPGLIAHLYTAAWAFAEIREKLKRYEDAEEEGRLIVLPCKPGKMAYIVYDLRETDFPSVAEVVGPYHVRDVSPKGFWIQKKPGAETYFRRWYEVGKTVFWSKQKAEAARDSIIAEDTNVPGKKEE